MEIIIILMNCHNYNNSNKNNSKFIKFKILYNKIKDKNVFFNELLKKQIIGIPIEKKLNYNDIKRISKFIKSSIFIRSCLPVSRSRTVTPASFSTVSKSIVIQNGVPISS